MTTMIDWLGRCPLVAILRGVTPDEAVAVGEALVACGIVIVEVPLNSPSPFESIRRLAAALDGRALVGAGTVLDVEAVAAMAAAGGRLVVMPHADGRVVRAAKQAGLLAVPGFATPTEAFAMVEAGADALKLFPAEANPPAVLKAMRAVLPPAMPILPVGGIRPDSMADYLTAGASGFGLGSALYKPGDTPSKIADKAMGFRRALDALTGTATV
ncbi:MAG: 2-dehydro-3-deoxy-6-phosphogalactonate aldolase [Alphaproteobacteria bacterium]|nr:2-dehydro-3-deoxy-6-phosphogalactonate aldolase [Alphaproteobacteria bacterium]